MNKCKDCFWFYHLPERFADIKVNGEYMCTNREVEMISVNEELLACSLFREKRERYLGRVL